MRVLVTGVAGHLGSALAGRLLADGHRVAGVDIIGDGRAAECRKFRLEPLEGHDRFHFEQLDVADTAGIGALLGEFRPAQVVHLAARRDLQWAAEQPSSCLRLHAGAVLGLLDACHRQSVAQVVLVSSYHVYGGSRRYPFATDDPAGVQLSHLGAAFRAMELHAGVFAQTSPVGVTVARMFSLYGPGQTPGRFVPALCEAAEQRRPLPLVGDGTASRDFVFVDDAVEFLVKVMENPSPWRILNLASGSSTTLAQVAEQVSWLADVVYRTRSLPLRPGEMPQAWADMKEAERLGFVPRTQLAEGLRKYWQWHQNRPACFRPRPERRS